MTCIYCLESKPDDAFDHEHVIPRAFGTFEQNLVLQCVCRDCNKYFGATIDLKLGRDSPEGWDRVIKGKKAQGEFKGLGKRSTTQVTVLDGPLQGVLCEAKPAPEGQRLSAKKLPQVGFSNSEQGPFQYFLMTNLPSPIELQLAGYGEPLFFRTFGTSAEAAETALQAKGFPPNARFQKGEPTPKQGDAHVQFMSSHQEYRALAKITFNYLAAIAGPAVARMPQFNEVRRYIRFDVRPDRQLVGVGQPKLLQRAGRSVNGHILAFERQGDLLLGRVSMFGRLRYAVLLSQGPFAIETQWRSGHIFDVDARQIYPIDPGTRV